MEIVAEKTPDLSRGDRYASAQAVSAPHSYWMIGNSPKSDINPALAAGLNAVPPQRYLGLEHAALDDAPPGQLLIELDSFAKLSCYFLTAFNAVKASPSAPHKSKPLSPGPLKPIVGGLWCFRDDGKPLYAVLAES